MFYGDKLLTTSNPQAEKDRRLIDRLGMHCATEADLSADASAPGARAGAAAPTAAAGADSASAGACGHCH
jgi:biotin synthase